LYLRRFSPNRYEVLSSRCTEEFRTAIGVNMLAKLYVKASDFARGQTMAEYALILAAVAVVVFAGYQTMGTTITTMLTTVDSQL
jgi:Flp pilus assembly pilin Flp